MCSEGSAGPAPSGLPRLPEAFGPFSLWMRQTCELVRVLLYGIQVIVSNRYEEQSRTQVGKEITVAPHAGAWIEV